ncbi:hypothetical protein [Staphylococcus caeli]|uniref:Bacterial regulatory proteins, deoR family n=1 Tax=Staphylococcus caeli TaxID=2201815 RepID=A0A1D4S7H4_9STAP|nr:hypothetical protein [Staphylococcus caeli]SCT08714.1 Bacterial regulatory proteins, deoR family [Staphylococcus caeli]SCT55465.1 Bacterial regulatory proteins, deoR family [Staphylococcus caeli]
MSAIKSYFKEIINTIQWDDIIAFDNHPFAYRVIDDLYKKNIKISVISYSTDIIRYVSKYTDFNIIIPNGIVNSANHHIIGEDVKQTFAKYQIRYYFVTATHMNEEKLYQDNMTIAHIQSALNERAEQILLMNRPEIISLDLQHNYSEIGCF